MGTSSSTEAMREEPDFIRQLYSTAHSMSCDDPDCPWADLFNETSNVDSSTQRDALFLVLLGIVDNIGECLDLIRTLLAGRNDNSVPDCLMQPDASWDHVPSGTSSRSRSESTNTDAHDPLRQPPIPNLYHVQWTQSPAVSPPADNHFCHSHSRRSFPRAPTPSPATRGSDTTPSIGGTPIHEYQEGTRRCDQEDQHPAGVSTEPFFPAPRTTESSAGTPCHRSSSTDADSSDQHSCGRFSARVDSDNESDE